jgi:hypothetical protein
MLRRSCVAQRVPFLAPKGIPVEVWIPGFLMGEHSGRGVHAVGTGAGASPSCSSISSRSNIRSKETCLPSRKWST